MVKHLKKILLIWLYATIISIATYATSVFLFSIHWIISALIGFVAFLAAALILLILYIKKQWKASEALRYRKMMIRQAQKQIRELHLYKYKIRSFHHSRHIDALYKIANEILKIVKANPERYNEARRFFTEYMESTLTIVKKYTMLLRQPVQDESVKQSLAQSEQALAEMKEMFEKELLDILSKDQMRLDMELEYVKHTLRNGTK